MYSDTPVKIPDIPSKISFRKYKENCYVQYLTGRKYNREKKYTIPVKKTIGIRLAHMQTMMLPNDNYERYFNREGVPMADQLTTGEEQYIQDRNIYALYADFFQELYYEIKQQSRKNLSSVVTSYTAQSINRILKPLMELMQNEDYAECLSLVRIPDEDNPGMTYADVMILMTQFRTALSKYHRNN